MAEYNSQPLITAAQEFAKLPGIGLKTAQRLAYYILNARRKKWSSLRPEFYGQDAV